MKRKKLILLALVICVAVLGAFQIRSNRGTMDGDINIDGLHSKNAVLMRLSDGKIISSRNAEDDIYPASMTKIMTALVAIENLQSLDAPVEIPAALFDKLYAENASLAGFMPGEITSARSLLYGIMLPSGAECCIGMAEELCGTEEKFVALMNKKAAELGLSRTNFCNCTGLHDPNHKTTAQDMAVLLRNALKNETFYDIFTSRRYTTAPSNMHPEGFTFTSTMFKSIDNSALSGGALLGGKTGYTEQAGLCLASLASIGGTDYILITAAGSGNHQTEPLNILDALTVYSKLENIG